MKPSKQKYPIHFKHSTASHRPDIDTIITPMELRTECFRGSGFRDTFYYISRIDMHTALYGLYNQAQVSVAGGSYCLTNDSFYPTTWLASVIDGKLCVGCRTFTKTATRLIYKWANVPTKVDGIPF